MNVLETSNLKIWDTRNNEVIVNNLSFAVEEHKCTAIVGESGSGKSMSVKAINGIHKPWIRCEGNVLFEGQNLLEQSSKNMKEIRGKKIFMIFQDGMSAFDPSCTIQSTFREILSENMSSTKEEADRLILQSMDKVKLKNSKEILDKYPHQLSGGMLQRIMIALSLALEPKIIIADEPTTSLDTISQFKIVNEFMRLKKEYGTTMIFISHDLGVVRKLADFIIVMKDGEKVEEGPVEEVFCHPQNSYTQYLVNTRKALGENYKKLIKVCQNA